MLYRFNEIIFYIRKDNSGKRRVLNNGVINRKFALSHKNVKLNCDASG